MKNISETAEQGVIFLAKEILCLDSAMEKRLIIYSGVLFSAFQFFAFALNLSRFKKLRHHRFRSALQPINSKTY